MQNIFITIGWWLYCSFAASQDLGCELEDSWKHDRCSGWALQLPSVQLPSREENLLWAGCACSPSSLEPSECQDKMQFFRENWYFFIRQVSWVFHFIGIFLHRVHTYLTQSTALLFPWEILFLSQIWGFYAQKLPFWAISDPVHCELDSVQEVLSI